MTAHAALLANPLPVAERVLPALPRLEEYEIEQVLAQSSFAVVYRAYDHALKLQVAIKEYLPAALALRSADMQVMPRSPDDAERFELGRQAFIGEAQTLARCDHPALLRIMRVLQRHGTVYRVMRYCPGPTLLVHRRDAAKAPDMAMLRLWLDQLLAALQALHDEGCVHGAVAPGNIVLGPGDRPVLLDFDAVRAVLVSDRTQSMTTALEPCFAPVEQRQPAAHMPVGPWTDLYSLAASLHFCVSGQLPTPVARNAPAGFEPLSAVWQRRGLADGQDATPLFDALDACLAGLPEYRPQSVAQFRGLLLARALPHATPAASRLVPESIAAQEPPVRPHAPKATPQPTSPLPEAQPLLDDFEAAHDVASITATALQPRRDWLFVGSVLAALAILGIALWWESTGVDPLSKRNDEPAAAAMALPAAEAVARSDLGVSTLPPPPAAARPKPSPPHEPPDLSTQATQTTATTPAAQPAAPPPGAKLANAPAPAPAPTSPREVCGKRTQFALYRCMQTQCARPNWSPHEQCRRLRLSDAVH